jgi:hypothetical protein
MQHCIYKSLWRRIVVITHVMKNKIGRCVYVRHVAEDSDFAAPQLKTLSRKIADKWRIPPTQLTRMKPMVLHKRVMTKLPKP